MFAKFTRNFWFAGKEGEKQKRGAIKPLFLIITSCVLHGSVTTIYQVVTTRHK